jgi:hypothetical protein
MRPDWNVETHSDAIKFLSRAFKHLAQRDDSDWRTTDAMGIIVNAQGAVLDASFAEAA